MVLVLLALVLSGCASSRKVTYLRNMQPDLDYIAASAPAVRIEKNDKLLVRVFSDVAELARPFNLTTGSEVPQDVSYLVEGDGCIDFPVIGRVPLEGCTLKESEARIRERISEMGYIKEPVVNVSLENFAVTVLGKTNNSVLKVEQDQINLLQVLAMSGGTELDSDINKVMVIRTEDGKRTAHTVDLQSVSLFDSPVFYMKQNDIVYVKPNALQITETGKTIFSVIGTSLSAATLVAYIMVLVSR